LAANVSAGIDSYVGMAGTDLANAAENGLPIGQGAALAAPVRPLEGRVDDLPEARVGLVGVGIPGVAPEDDASFGKTLEDGVEGYGEGQDVA
jgi:hypothetical protein